jgi:hypothetical protein
MLVKADERHLGCREARTAPRLAGLAVRLD